MRRDVVVLTVAMVAVAGIALWSGRHDVADIASTGPPPATSDRSMPVASATRAQAAPAMPAPGSRPIAPLNRYRSGNDLWGAYQALRGSTHGGELWVAETIVRGCLFTTRPASIAPRTLAGHGVTVFDPMTQEEADAFEAGTGKARTHVEKATDDQMAAARELLERCRAFVAMTGVEYRIAVDDATSRRRHADDPVAIAEAMGAHRLPVTDDRMRFVLDSRDPAALDFVVDDLADRFAKHARPVSTEDDTTADRQALRLLQCDLGNDCDANSEPALLDCLQHADGCRLDVPAQVMAGATPALRASIAAHRQTMREALQRGDYAIWGL